MENDPGLFEIMFTTRAMRRLKPDPVPREMVEQILRAGQAAPTGGNAQHWGFLVVEDAAIKKQIQGYYAQAWEVLAWPHYEARLKTMPEGEERDTVLRQIKAVEYLTDHFHEAPVWIVACLDVGRSGGDPFTGASIYPAVQNMLLAARALGLGATLTSRHVAYSKEVDAILGLPETVRSFAILPIGFPLGKFGPVRRKPLSEFVYLDGWGKPYLKDDGKPGA